MKYLLLIIIFLLLNYNTPIKYYNHSVGINIVNISPNSLKIYYLIKKYSKEYNIPEKYLYNVIELETGYTGPFHYEYLHSQTSYMGAEGPFQLMLPTAKFISNNNNLTKYDIRYNIELNVELAIKYIDYLRNRYNNWAIVFAIYNTGRPIINNYAKKVIS